MDDGETVRRLVDIEEIKQLKARYFRSLDGRRWDDFAAVFARDARLVVPEGDMLVDGRDAIAAAVSGSLVGARTVHHGHMPEIVITGPDTARGIWAMFDYVDFGGADGTPVGIVGYGHYHEEYVREDGAWRIARLELSRLRVDPLPGGYPGAHAGARS
jgi:uncharacterized protein (TIGR02246 family)